MAEELHRKYRPEVLDEVIGQAAVVRSLKKIVERKDVHCFLLDGPSGCGKTTIARIIAQDVGCDMQAVVEIDAATNSGADAMRAIQEPLRYRPFGSGKARAVIIDECHSLSKQAWQTLLKGTEEPNEFVFWFFCTTESGKVPQTMKTRAARFTVKLLDNEMLTSLCDDVCKEERIKLASGVQDLLIRSALGSPRQLLVNLAVVRDCVNRKEAAEALRTVGDDNAIGKLCQLLINGNGTWSKAMAIYEDMKDENPESVRIIVMNYLAKAVVGAPDKRAGFILEVMENFAQPYNDSEKAAPLLLSIGRTLLAE